MLATTLIGNNKMSIILASIVSFAFSWSSEKILLNCVYIQKQQVTGDICLPLEIWICVVLWISRLFSRLFPSQYFTFDLKYSVFIGLKLLALKNLWRNNDLGVWHDGKQWDPLLQNWWQTQYILPQERHLRLWLWCVSNATRKFKRIVDFTQNAHDFMALN